MTYEEKIEALRNKTNAESLKAWKKEEWILPELMDYSNKNKSFYRLRIDKTVMRTQLLPLRFSKEKYNSVYSSCT